MKKSVFLPYDRYQRLLTGMEQNDKSVTKSEQEHSSHIEMEDNPRTTVNAKEVGPTSAVTTKASETLTQHFPKPMQNRLRSLLTYIQPHVSWNDKGEITIEQTYIPGSNIVDLIKVHLKDYKHFCPEGKEAFGKLLLELNVPTSLLSASARQQWGSGNLPLPPPPGIPVKRIHSKNTVEEPKQVKWLRLRGLKTT